MASVLTPEILYDEYAHKKYSKYNYPIWPQDGAITYKSLDLFFFTFQTQVFASYHKDMMVNVQTSDN